MGRLTVTDCRRVLAAAVLFASVWSGFASAEQPLRLIVPYPAGSGSDVIARMIAAELTPRLGQQVIVINQSGASGFIATQAVHAADPDGNTLLLTSTNHVLIPAVRRDVPFDVVTGFEPVMLLCTGPLVIAVNPQFPYKTVPELIAAAKKAPGTINYASAGTGSAPHLAAELLSTMAGIKLVQIPYRGGAPAITDVVAGVVPFYFSTIASALPFFESKLAIAMALTSKKRPSFIKDIPTIAEQTGLDYDVEYWYGFLAPPKTPPERIKKLHTELAAIANTPKIREFINRQGFEVKPNTTEEFKAYIKSEAKLWLETAAAANVKPE
jgi:tripartite-type tricarboxylate transporter receptor subunit TctC